MRKIKSKKVTLLKSGNLLVVEPTTRAIYDLLSPKLTFRDTVILRGAAKFKARKEGRKSIEITDYECFGLDGKGRMGFAFGYWKRVSDRLKEAGYKVTLKDLQPHPKPEIFIPQWDRIKDITLKPGQDEFLIKFFSNPCGRFDCPPGFGKSFMIGVIARLLPKAKIDVVTKRVAVARDRIYPELCQMVPSVGMVGGGKNKNGCRVQIFTAGSYHRAGGDADILIMDESHELACDSFASKLGNSLFSRNYGLSASHDMRLDNKDIRVEGMCGPVVYGMTYQEALENKMVVPITVKWTPVVLDYDVCEDVQDVERKRLGLWTNDARNDLIAKDARRYDKDTQVLITVETIEHAVNLKARLPEYKIVHKEDGMTLEDRKRYIKAGLLSPKEPVLDRYRKQKLTDWFSDGRLKKAIVTTVWNVGVSFNALSVLIRADGGGSPINDIQIPGRASRTDAGKEESIIHDYIDHFNPSLRRKSNSRRKTYERQGWTQILPPKASFHSLDSKLGLIYETEED